MRDVISRTATSLLSTKAAAVLSGVKGNRVRQLARDLKIGKLARRVHRRSFGPRDLLFLRLTANIPVPLTRELERDLYAVVVKGMISKGLWKTEKTRLKLGELVTIDARALRKGLAHDLRVYRSAAKRVASSSETMGGEPVFKGTRISVTHVGAVAAKGIPVEEILEDYPRLSRDDVRLALLLHRMGRRPGRPRRSLRFVG
jgi:uncharacterized protein (DUF433 family)